jgi:hypothetical protein
MVNCHTPPHLRPRELWRLDIHGEGLVQCFYLAVEKAALLHINGSVRDCIRCEHEDDTLKAAVLWKDAYEIGTVLFSTPPAQGH